MGELQRCPRRLSTRTAIISAMLIASLVAPPAFAESVPDDEATVTKVKRPFDGGEFGLQLILGIPTTFLGGFLGLLTALAATDGFGFSLSLSGGGCDGGWAPGTCDDDDWPQPIGWGIGAAVVTGVAVPLFGKVGYKRGGWGRLIGRSMVGSFTGAAVAFGIGMLPADRNDQGGPAYVLSSALTVPLGAALCYHFCPFLNEQTTVGVVPSDDGAVFTVGGRF